MITESIRTGDDVVIRFEPGTADRREAATHVRRYARRWVVRGGWQTIERAAFVGRSSDTFTYRMVPKTSP